MEPATARIPVRSQRQAMDWSLVLISQGIEVTIDPGDEGAGWGLLVPRQDCARALQTLRQYRRENRAGPAVRCSPGPVVRLGQPGGVWSSRFMG